MEKKGEIQTSETIRLGIILAIAGGFMDAYSYMCRGEVFANAQTGNMLLFGIHLSAGEKGQALRYLAPVVAFALGIALAALLRLSRKEKNSIHWRQVTVLIEAIILFAVGFVPQTQNLLANSLTSLACGMQVESFRKIHGNGIATTMCIGNLRNATWNFCEFMEKKNRENLKKSFLYLGIITFFVIGAVFGNSMVNLFREKAIFICSIFHFAAFLVMFSEAFQAFQKPERKKMRKFWMVQAK